MVIVSGLFFSSCKKDLAALNKNPNRPEQVQPEYLLNTSILNTMNLFGGDMRRRVFSHYSNYVSVGGGQMERYGIFLSSNNGYWQSAYTGSLQPVYQIQRKFGDDPDYKNRVLIAKIFESYIYSNMVAIWGSLPKTEALHGTDVVPYDKEEDIYYDLLNELKSAAAAMDLNGDTYTGQSDAIYQGDLVKWKKFANTLRLRIAMRISNANPEKAREVAADVLSDPANTFQSLNETADANWGLTSNTWSYLYEYNVFEKASHLSSLNVISESLVQHMLPYNDPRLAVYATPSEQGPMTGKYWGQPKTTALPPDVSMTNNPHSNRSQLDYSQIGSSFTAPDASYEFLSYEESLFLKAEAALKGWGGNAAASEYYNQGIRASMQKYNIPSSAIDAYLSQPGVAWNTAVDTTGRGSEFTDYLEITTSAILNPDPFRQIVMQEWLALFFNGIEAWNLIRRTQVLEFPPHFNPDGTAATPEWGYAYIPQRLVYPDIEYQVNPDELAKALSWLGGPDALDTKLWFALPTKRNPYLPH